MRQRLVVVGGDAAAMSAASAARRLRGPDDLEIVAFERGSYTSYSACGIPYFIGNVVGDLDALIARTPEQFAHDHAIEARVRHEVMAIDLDRRAVLARDLATGVETWEAFDQLMIATGAVPIRPPLPGVDAAGIFGVQTLDDGLAVRAALEAEPPRSAVVVGAGYIGLELAEALCARGIPVTVIQRGRTPMDTLDPDMGGMLVEAMQRFTMTLRLEETVTGFETDAGRVRAVVTDQGTVPADLVILGLGVRPNSELAAAAGIPLGPTGAIAVDQRLRTRVAGVWAAGDCVEKFHYVEVGRTGLGEAEAEAAGFEAVSVSVDSTTRAGYYPGARPIRTKLVAERGSGRLLGAQIVGEEGAAKRIDVLAAALWHETTVSDLLNVDLSYAPPFSPVRDPVLIAARKAWQRVESYRRSPEPTDDTKPSRCSGRVPLPRPARSAPG